MTQPSSGTYNFNPDIGSCIVEAFDRIQMRPAELTTHHLSSARRSCNLVLQHWSNFGCNLWTVTQANVPLVQGVLSYSVPSNTIMILDAYLRQYAMNGPTNITLPAFSTQVNSSNVTITYANNGLSVGNWINVVIPVSIGGIILYGFYQATSVTSANTFIINAGVNATSTVSSGGVIPIFTVTANSTTVSVNLPNHGYVAGATFVVQVSTTLGGLQLFGTYTVLAVTDANNFTFTAAYAAGFNATATENSGQAQIAVQVLNQQPVDRIIWPISRTDYASLPNKYQQGFPTTFWYDRVLNQTISLWQVPDSNGPYELIYYYYTQIQDANPTMGQTLNLPTRFFEAFCADLAWHLARKWKPELEAVRKADADAERSLAQAEDRERVSMFLMGDFTGYYQ